RRNAAGSSRIPSRLAHRAPAHPAVLNRRDFVEAAPALPGDPRLRLPPASPRRCDGGEMDGLSPPSATTAPRGAVRSVPPPFISGGEHGRRVLFPVAQVGDQAE